MATEYMVRRAEKRLPSSQEEHESIAELRRQIVEANTTIAVLTEQLKAATKTQERLEKELGEARANAPELMMELAISRERLQAAEMNQARLEKQLVECEPRITKELPRLETELAVALEQLKAYDDTLKAMKQKHSLQLENIELQLRSMEETYELHQRAVLLASQSKTLDVLALSGPVYLAPMVLMPDTLKALTCVTFVIGNSLEVIEEKMKRLRGERIPGTKAILVESEDEANNIKQSIVDYGVALLERKRDENPVLVDVEFSNEPNKLCTRHCEDEAMTREEFLRLFKYPFASFGELMGHIVPEIEKPVEKKQDTVMPSIRYTASVNKLLPKAMPSSKENVVEETIRDRRWRLPGKGGSNFRRVGLNLSEKSR
ncbi:hypothetical protein CCR75_005891 [Bremia lactucae]|uniref:Uncharacterized protein n=1 Tax=Bremia lactucae TaxID=4779 RepID=A0A976FMN4_BRELC|nr:hypothetical protein CCR75_005891 [Bremia lactucae]